MGMAAPSGGIERFDDIRNLEDTGTPNSRTDLYKNGQKVQSRWYGADGRAQRNRDYSNHGNPKQHPNVPHDHPWDWGKTPPRGKDVEMDTDWI